jgi:hypothetical protein
MDANESYLEAHISRESRQELEDIEIERLAREKLAHALTEPVEYVSLIDGYQIEFTSHEKATMLRSVSSAIYSHQNVKACAIARITDCIARLEAECLERCRLEVREQYERNRV